MATGHSDIDQSDIRHVLSAHQARRGRMQPRARKSGEKKLNTTIHEVERDGAIYRTYDFNMAHITYNISNYNASKSGSLIDRGANGGLVGDDVTIKYKTGRFVDVSGIDNHTVNNLEIVTAAGYVHTSKGPRIVIMNQYAYLGHGKSIHCATQMEHYEHDVDDKAYLLGGTQSIKTLDGVVIPLAFRNGLPYMDIRPCTDEEYDSLPHIILTSDDAWDPAALDHEFKMEDGEYVGLEEDPYVHSKKFDEKGDYMLREDPDLKKTKKKKIITKDADLDQPLKVHHIDFTDAFDNFPLEDLDIFQADFCKYDAWMSNGIYEPISNDNVDIP